MLISIIVPVYNEENNIVPLTNRLISVFGKVGIDFELIFINDGSTDRSLDVIRCLSEGNVKIKLINLSRNFGHQPAITAGLDSCTGDCAVIIDADLQDPPELIENFISKWNEGYEVVYAQRKKRKGESGLKKVAAYCFYRILKFTSNIDIPLDTGDFRLIDRKVIDILRRMPEKQRFVRGMISWIGFKQAGIRYERDKRQSGKTKYSFLKMLKFASTGITSFSFVPLKIATFFGFIVSFVSFIYAAYVVYLKLFTEETVSGWASLMVVILFLSGIQLITIGIIGEYLSGIGEEIKRRPVYVIDERLNFGGKSMKIADTSGDGVMLKNYADEIIRKK